MSRSRSLDYSEQIEVAETLERRLRLHNTLEGDIVLEYEFSDTYPYGTHATKKAGYRRNVFTARRPCSDEVIATIWCSDNCSTIQTKGMMRC